MIWQLNLRLAAYFAAFDADVVVYDNASGHTHLLQPPISQLYLELIKGHSSSKDDNWVGVDLSLQSQETAQTQLVALQRIGIVRQLDGDALNSDK